MTGENKIKNKMSIIIPCYNDGKYLREAINSVRLCKKDLYEIIIIDDGSEDTETKKVLAELSLEKNIILIKINHSGQSAARNIGVKAAKYPYLLFLDSDNKINPKYIEEGIRILDENPEVGIVYGDFKQFGISNNEVSFRTFSICGAFLHETTIDTCSVVRKKAYEDCGGYDESMFMWEDWEFSINIAAAGWEFFHIEEIMFYYRMRKNSVNCQAKKRENRIKALAYVYKKHFPLFVEHLERQMKVFNPQLASDYFNELECEKAKNADLQARLNDIEKGLVWKVFSFYKKIIEIFLPRGSLIRKGYDWLILANQNLINKKKYTIVKKKFDWSWQEKNVDILFINHEESLTGAPKVLFEIAKEISNAYDVSVLCLKFGGPLNKDFVKEFKYIIYPQYIAPGAEEYKKALKVLKDVKPRIVYANTVASYTYARAAKKLGIPVIFHTHELSSVFNDYLSSIEIENFKEQADAFIAPSNAVRDYLVNELKCDRDKVLIISEIINYKKVLKESLLADKKNIQEMKKKKNQVVVLACGTVTKRKGADLYFKAYKILEKKYRGVFKFLWLGSAPFGEKEFFGKEKSANFIFLGEKANPYPYIKAADFFVLPSREDPFPLVVLEALALNKPIIAFKNSGGAAEAIGDAGILVDSFDENELANAIEALAKDKNLVEFLIEKTKTRIKYDSKTEIERIKCLISEILYNNYGLGKELMQKKMVSVIIPNHNYAWALSDAIDSIIAQTYENWEIIIIDDNSTDNSEEVIKGYVRRYPGKIKFFVKDKKEKGLALSYRKGIKEASGEIIAFLEADDIWEKNNLENKLKAFEKYPDLACVFGNAVMFGNNKKFVEEKKEEIDLHLRGVTYPGQPFNMKEMIKKKICVKTFSSVLVQKKMLENIDFEADCKVWFDWYFHAQLSKKGKYIYIPEKLVKWRAHKKSYTSTFFKSKNWYDDHDKVYMKILNVLK